MPGLISNTYLQRMTGLVGCILGLSLTVSVPLTASAQDQERCTDWVGKVVSVEGVVEARRVAHTTWEPTKVGETFCPGDKLRVETWRAAIVLANDTIIRLDQGTTITFTEIENKESSWLELLEGIVHFLSRVPHTLTITTPFVNATVEGTEFVIRVDDSETNVWVLEGTVQVENSRGQLLLAGGEAAVAREGEAPKRQLNVKPRDAVQWALYYPPLLDISKEAPTGPNQGIYQKSLSHYQAGEIQQALDELNTIPVEQRDPQFWGTRAGLLLAVGQIDKANINIDEALRQEPKNGTALALKSVVALVNNKEDALQLANQSVASAPESSVGHVAKSYAQQAHFDIEQALDSAQQATRYSPEDALAWARVAELQLSLGNLSDAREAAQQAVALNPRLARTQTILGFALLTEAKIADARETFETAIALNQAAPLPRLGLGLTKIQKSHLAEGRRDIEIAASLDPSNAIIRSYLGKAYFEEKWDRPLPKYPLENLAFADLHDDTKQNKRAAAQLQMAKELEPQDPTPYFYDAIRKQTVNRPVEALQDLQKSIELNDNRAIYRSKLLLDDDKAARSASLGRIYKDLGFQQRARVEGWNSLLFDPTSHSSHRLLADSYAGNPRLEIARTSELLQSQLFQSININNLQPQLSEASLQILEGAGPSSTGFNEFNPMFIRDRLALLGNLAVGSFNTISDDVVLSGMLADPVSLTLGQFHYSTDGFRTANDNTIDLYNVFLQGEITPQINLQAEYQNRETDRGDLVRNFDPKDFLPKFKETIQSDLARVGGRISLLSNMDVLLSGIHVSTRANANTGTTPNTNVQSKFKAYQGEGQTIIRNRLFNTIWGGRVLRIDGKAHIGRDAFSVPFPPFMIPAMVTDSPADLSHESVYFYLYAPILPHISWTGGLAYSHDESDLHKTNVKRILPKAGLQWDVTDWARLRVAYFQTVKSKTTLEQSIEPTQIAGFNQAFIDAPGTRSTSYGVALDTIVLGDIYSGLNFSHREYSFLSLIPGEGTRGFEFRTDVYQAYFYWPLGPQWAISSNVEWEKVYRPANIATEMFGDGRFTQLDTYILPLSIRYFHPSGFFAGLSGTFLIQDLDLPVNARFKDSHEGVFLLDFLTGFRLPKRLGIITAEIRNLTDQQFHFQDPNVLRPGVGNQRFIPDISGVFKITLAIN